MRWADIDALSVLSTPFSDERFVAGLSAVFGWSVRRVDTTSGLHALLVERHTGPLREIVLPPFAPWSALAVSATAASGPISSDASTNAGRAGAGLTQLCGQLKAQGVPALLSLPPAWPGPLPTLPGWSVRERETAVLATGDLDSVLSAYSSSARRTFRKHEDAFVCEERSEQAASGSSVESAIHAVVALVAEAYQRHGRTIPGGAPSRLADLAQLMVGCGRARVYTARNRTEGRVDAGIVALHRGETAWYWLSGSVPGPAMTVLVAHVAADLAGHGIQHFDLMGANTPSIAEFKRRLGAERVGYQHLTYAGTGLPALVAATRRTVRRFRGRS